MCIRMDIPARHWSRSLRAIRRRACVATVAAGLGIAGQPWTALAGDAEVGVTNEGSVLVAMREAPVTKHTAVATADKDADEDHLEPISQHSEHSPELSESAASQRGNDSTGSNSKGSNSKGSDDDKFADALADASTAPAIDAQPAKFNGIQPGKSTEKDVRSAWHEPKHTSSTDDSTLLTYDIEPFRSVEVQISKQAVAAIKIELQSSLPPKRLAKQLSLDKLDAVAITDDEGVLLGQAYPERGVLFMFAPPSDVVAATTNAPPESVTHVVIQPLDADAFALRAESRLQGPYEQNINDLKTALMLNPNFAHAHWLLAEIYLATGQADLAKSEAEDACEIDPDNAAYQLRKAQAQIMIGQYDDATLAIRAVLDSAATPPIVKAQALHEMGQLAALGDAEIAAKSVAFENRSIALADSLATSKNVKERRAAKEVLVKGHLAVARQIAKQDYSNKLPSVSQWIGRASGLAEDMIAHDGGSIELRLLVAKESLESLASFKSNKDPAPWISEAEEAATALTEQCSDDLWRRRVQWELGQAYFQAVRIEHLRMQPASALRYGQLAIENLADGAAKRQAVFDSEQLVGELYFHIGVVHAVEKQDHKTAAQWYDKAMPLLTAPRPASTLLAPQHDGEELVSMGVTYWQIGEKDHAIDLTLNGVELVEKAVEGGVLPKTALAVPYGNLATMYEQLGEKDDAAKYSELAKSAGVAPKTAVATNNHSANLDRMRPTMAVSQRQMNGPNNPQRSLSGQNSRQPLHRTAQRPSASELK
jgi:tetratricopeptide (TPR) repeat protein